VAINKVKNVQSKYNCPNRQSTLLIIGNDMNNILKKSYKTSYNLEFIEFETGNYNELNEGLAELALSVQKIREANSSA